MVAFDQLSRSPAQPDSGSQKYWSLCHQKKAPKIVLNVVDVLAAGSCIPVHRRQTTLRFVCLVCLVYVVGLKNERNQLDQRNQIQPSLAAASTCENLPLLEDTPATLT